MLSPSQKKQQKQKAREETVRKRKEYADNNTRIPVLLYNAELLFQNGDWKGVIAECRRIFTINSSHFRTLYIYAESHSKLKNYARCAGAYVRLSVLEPDNKYFLFNAVVSYFHLRDFQTAMRLGLQYLQRHSTRDKNGENMKQLVADAERLQHSMPQIRTETAVRRSAPASLHSKIDTSSGKTSASAPLPETTPLPELERLEPSLQIRFEEGSEPVAEEQHNDTMKRVLLRIRWEHLQMQDRFEELLCIAHLQGVQHFGYQVQTVRKVLRDLHGRALLADEVGLGKTIEAGMIIKEYLLRGMAQTVLVLCPPSLVFQWASELRGKFGIHTHVQDSAGAALRGKALWSHHIVVASLHTAKTQANRELVTEKEWDIVVVDESHHLKNRRTQAWDLVNNIRKKFLLLLSATPIQNSLIELYNLLTLLKPGVFPPEKEFLRTYCDSADSRKPKNAEKLRLLMRDVMIRNVRASCGVAFPRRLATTIKVTFNDEERAAYDLISDIARRLFALHDPKLRFVARTMLERAGAHTPLAISSLRALGGLLAGHNAPDADAIALDAGNTVQRLARLSQGTEKIRTLADIIAKGGRQVIVFCRFSSTVQYVASELGTAGCACSVFHGGMTPEDRAASIETFRQRETAVLISSESGGEGQNLQFCNALVNFDLPWNPMRIEQRIGRIHRIGQHSDVFIFNLCYRGSLEEKILEILEGKIRMFELVMGEVDTILGPLEEQGGFDEVVMDLWASHSDAAERDKAFDKLADSMVQAREQYLEACRLDGELFGREMEA